MTLTACGTSGAKTSSRVCPNPLALNIIEQESLSLHTPAFYIRFTQQQAELREIK